MNSSCPSTVRSSRPWHPAAGCVDMVPRGAAMGTLSSHAGSGGTDSGASQVGSQEGLFGATAPPRVLTEAAANERSQEAPYV